MGTQGCLISLFEEGPTPGPSGHAAVWLLLSSQGEGDLLFYPTEEGDVPR